MNQPTWVPLSVVPATAVGGDGRTNRGRTSAVSSLKKPHTAAAIKAVTPLTGNPQPPVSGRSRKIAAARWRRRGWVCGQAVTP
jgi:hypothetical protein